jgi:hypothetical protein
MLPASAKLLSSASIDTFKNPLLPTEFPLELL